MDPLRSQDPERLGEFTLLARLGSGGMGRVYLGRSPGGMQVAVKVIREDIAEDADVLARFRREVATVRAVRSPYTARLVGASLEAAPYWLATEFVPGPTLLAAARRSSVEPDLCRGLSAALAEALAAVHGHGVVHRDVKPHNVILAPGGPQLIDFGIARAAEHTQLTHTGQTPGTPGYTAPEVLLGGVAGPAADVFALGATMAAAATGRAPYGRGEWPAVSYRVVHGEIDVDGVEPTLAALIRQCVAREPAQRPDPAEIVRRCGVTVALADSPAYQRLVGTVPPVPPVPPVPAAPVLPASPPPAPPASPPPAPPASPPPAPLAARRRRGPWVATTALVAAALGVTAAVWLLPGDGDDATAGDAPDHSPTASATDADSGDSTPPEREGGRESLTIGVSFDQPGMGLRTAQGEQTGFDIDVARYVADYLGVAAEDITWREAPATDRGQLLIRGEVDLVVAAYQITPEREERVDFAGPYLTTSQDLLIRVEDEVSDIAALNDLTLCSASGTTSAQVVKEGLAPGVTIAEYQTYSECVAALENGVVDALTTDDCLLVGYASQDGNAGRFRLAGLGLSSEYGYGVGVPEGETELRDDVNAAIARMIEDGTWAKAVATHLDGVTNYHPTPPQPTTRAGRPDTAADLTGTGPGGTGPGGTGPGGGLWAAVAVEPRGHLAVREGVLPA